MGLPPVAVGLVIYLLLSRAGPLGVLGLLVHPHGDDHRPDDARASDRRGALAHQFLQDLWHEYAEQLHSLGVGPGQALLTMLWEGRFSLTTAVLAGFGRASAEVGAVMIVGGNIEHATRTMTTAIALETSMGNLSLALGLGMLLMLLSLLVNGAAYVIRDLSRQPAMTGGAAPGAPRRGLGSGWLAPDRRHRPRRRRGPAHRDPRPQRRRQEPAAQALPRPAGAQRRQHQLARARRGRSQGAPGHGLPAPRAVASVRRGQCRLCPEGSRASAAATGAPASPPRFRAPDFRPARASPARDLSIGEQQRLALARAWASEPELLFLDEPTASLDPAATHAVEAVIGAMHQAGCKIVMTTHDLGQARRVADEILFMHRGRILERQAADRFFDRPATEEATAFLAGTLKW